MPKAEINLPDGTKIVIDGSVDDIIRVQQAFSNKSSTPQPTRGKDASHNIPKKRTSKIGPLGRIRILVGENFFNEKRNLEEVRKILEERAIFYKTSDITPSLIRLVKKGELRRLKEDGQWRYVNP